MPYQQISEETKRHIIAAYEGDEDYVLMATLLNLSRQAAWQLARRYLNDGQVQFDRWLAAEASILTSSWPSRPA